MITKKHNKLVHDKIPGYLKKLNISAVTHKLNDEKYQSCNN